ncbi:unnamed protein product, partial [Mesorhabditis spiculigera]
MNGHSPQPPPDQEIEEQSLVIQKMVEKQTNDYLNYLTQVRNWVVECLKDDSVPPAASLPGALSNGVLLARLGHSFEPEVVPLKNVFDLDEKIYNARLAATPDDPERAKNYKYTNNINLWMAALQKIKLPKIFYPDTVDVYEGRNVQTIYCIYAMANLLFRMRRGPPIREVKHQVYTEEERAKVEDQAKNLPAFGNVGNIISGSRKEDALRKAAIEQIEAAVRERDNEKLLPALQHHDAQIWDVEADLLDEYAQLLHTQLETDGSLTAKSVQTAVSETNTESALKKIDALLRETNVPHPLLWDYLTLLHPETALRMSAMPLYIVLVRESLNAGAELKKEDVARVVAEANALLDVKLAAVHDNPRDTLDALRNAVLDLDVDDQYAKPYHKRLAEQYRDTPEDFFLRRNELEQIVVEFKELSPELWSAMQVRSAVERQDRETLGQLLAELFPDVYIADHLDFYHESLKARGGMLPHGELKQQLEHINTDTSKAFETAELLVVLNEALKTNDRENAGATLQLLARRNPDKSTSFRKDLLECYLDVLFEETVTRSKRRLDKAEPEGESWFWHETPVGTVAVEVNERKFHAGPKEPRKSDFIQADELEKTYFQQNLAVAEKVKRNTEERQKNEAAAAIQRQYRKWLEEKNALNTTDSPSLALLRRYLPKKEEQEAQLAEQLAIQQEKAEVIQLAMSNQQLGTLLEEQYTNIGLLIKNKMNRHDILAHKKKVDDSAGSFHARTFTLKRKEKEMTDKLGQLFYLLQTEPKHLASLVLATSPEKHDSLLAKVVAPIYGHLAENREQFLAVGLLTELLKAGLEQANTANVNSTPQIQIVASALRSGTFSPMVPKLSQKPVVAVLDEFFAEQKLEVENGENQDGGQMIFNLDPEDIYKSIYGRVAEDPESAASCEKVKAIMDGSKEFLVLWSERLADALAENYVLSKGLRLLGTNFRTLLATRFPGVNQENRDNIVASLLYEAIIRPQIGLLNWQQHAQPGEELPEACRQKLESVVQFIGFAVANKGYKKKYLDSLNSHLHLINVAFRKSLIGQLEDTGSERLYGINRFSVYNPAEKPSLSILAGDLKRVIDYVHKHHKNMSMDGSVSKLTSACKAPHESDPEQVILIFLHPGSINPHKQNEPDELFVRTKMHITELLQSGVAANSVSELVTARPSDENEDLHSHLYPDSGTIREVQMSTRENLQKLVVEGRVAENDGYQALLTDIADDIRQSQSRKDDRSEQKRSLDETRQNLVLQREELRSRHQQYSDYLENCLDNFSRTTKRMSIRPTSGKAEKIQKARLSHDTRNMTYKASGDKLHKKGILDSVEGVEKLSKLTIKINGSETAGAFEMVISDGKKFEKSAVVTIQELLTAEDNQEQKFRVADAALFATEPLIQLFHKKFYNK